MQPAGRPQHQRADARTAAMAPKPPQVTADSPAGQWMARVKAAAPGEFAALLEEVPNLFPEYESAKREAASKWLLGLWITRDTEGALDYVAGKSGDRTLRGYFGVMLVRVAPEKAVPIFQKKVLGYPFTEVVLRYLAETDPLTFLKIEPPGFHQDSPFARALRTLAGRDPAAAAAALVEKGANYPDDARREALVAIVNAWMARDAEALRDWLTGLKDADLRHRAQHVWLTALAKTDAAAAQRELAKMDAGAWLTEEDGRVAIVTALARENLPAAVLEMKRLTAAAKATEASAETSDPFASGSGSPRDMWWAVAKAVAPRLPRDPALWLPALREIGKDCEMDAGERQSLQRHLADIRIQEWNTETALEAMKMLLSASSPPRDELSDSLRNTLTRKLTQADPELSLQYYGSLPEAARKELSFEFIRGIINAGDPALTLRMAPLVPLERWWMSGANTLAGELAKTPEAAKTLIEALPLNSNYQEAHADFAREWGRRDPAAAAQWVASRPENVYAAQGLAESWAGFDDTAASAWAAALPEGKLRDGAARGLVNALAPIEPEAAWKWASAISIPYQAAQAYRDLARWWGNKAPPEFVAALNEAMKHSDASDREAALESMKQPPPERHINP
jgi:hypothetical protein